MSDAAERAKAKREQAEQARRWSRSMSLHADRERLLAIAADLDREAAELERRATQSVTHIQQGGYSTTQPMQQVQVQQQQEQQQPDDSSKEPKS
jgi:hypothetical protein